MTHYGLMCPASTGHWNTILPLGKELQQRGHRVTLIGILDAQAKAQAAGLEFRVIGESEFPLGSSAEFFAKLGQLNGQEAFKYTIQLFKDTTNISLRDAPKVIKDAGIEALLMDQIMSEGRTIADVSGLPFITICSAVVLNREPSVPPFMTNWDYSPAWWAKLRNKLGYKLLNRATQPITELINNYRREKNLSAYSNANDRYSQLAQISQQPAELEFPRHNLPQCFHFTGPYHSSTGRVVPDFPFDKLTGQPLIYASLGTIQNRLLGVFQSIAEACQNLDAQLVISLGGSASPEVLQGLPGNPLVVGYAPQLQLLEKAELTITHAGMNTTLECLTNGVPMVAIPIANDQPGVASRIVWSGCGEAVPVKKVNADNLRIAIKKVLTEDSYRKNALRLQAAIQKAGGTKRAIDIVEQAISTGKPVLN
ncbi:glycosyltransferase [Dolichospermum sp. ST_sed1]|nr:glycosyltransferase [Dolichospermum sp. ST_sed1]MDD1424169.1 glycosyltransferase [Dolichospermum sp. ST_sed9]MDD1430816.1 glycosyltransferase [Dolichospermum sp. ST_sed6]MDD1435507.1 glycosyltransferase [Dolichospermum sp. ST_sed10]MDD1438914.1 glycosyltransferase [Dolichospermum sp. ST_sed3]MDD1445176.1 glycosyltransferase [Dolichospermum sp. ST_sed8]MDD1453591.1 glycosyltransferase [Dolichospermum sp. ST_sed7]MDD1459255.1 glycosyltransferase [Dolichospermum sp. ST_sed2]MDD1465500.1 gly